MHNQGFINKAVEIAKEITIAKVQGSTSSADEDSGKTTADFFKAVYDQVISTLDPNGN